MCDVDGSKSTWDAASTQIKTVVNNVVFPVVDVILAILFFVKIALMEFVKYAVRSFVVEAQEFRWGARAR